MNYLFRQIIIAIVVLLSIGVTSCSDGKKSEASDSQNNSQTDTLEAPVAVEENTDMDVFEELERDELVFVERGTFLMGAQYKSDTSANYNLNAESGESPVHQVKLNSYYIGKYEVTQQLWEYVMKYNGSCADGSAISAYAGDMWFGLDSLSLGNGKGNYYPAYNVSWEDVVHVFIPRLNKITGKTFRLPTEAEWEFAARGGNKSQGYQYSGGDDCDSIAWSRDNAYEVGEQSADYGSHEVGTKMPNELGIYDMSGNVEEWCNDWYGEYESFAQINPTGPIYGTFYVSKGGDWSDVTWNIRVAKRNSYLPFIRRIGLGFRLACSVPGAVEESLESDTEITNGKDVDLLADLEKDAMVFVAGGTFSMGAQSMDNSLVNYDDHAFRDEAPVHQVTLDSYYIGKYEVTQQLWEYVLKYNGICADGTIMNAMWFETHMSGDGIGYYFPIYNISYDNIVNVFIPRLNKITGKTFRLPTEAEWEYAARGGNKSQGYKYSGGNILGDVAWYKENAYDIWELDSNNRGTSPVGTKAPNELGIYDMSGNVEEWCSDNYADYSSEAQTNPTGAECGLSGVVIRGGSWKGNDENCRVSRRNFSHSVLFEKGDTGFRLVCSDL